MTLKRISAADTTRVLAKVVIVTMDNHLASAAARANHLLAKSMPGVTLSVHAASEWADDKASLARCIADIEQGDLVIASMLFM